MKNDRKAAAEAIWLEYFTRCLFERGLITEAERNRLAAQLSRRGPQTKAPHGKAFL